MISETLDKLVAGVKGLTLLNAAVVLLLLSGIVPAYVGYKVLSDPALLSIIMSEYKELPSNTDCTLVEGQVAGGQPAYFIRNQFQERKDEVWYMATKIKFRPDDEAMEKYCTSLNTAIDYIRDPGTAAEPMFPGSTRLLFPPSREARRQMEIYQKYEQGRNDAYSQEHP